MSQVWISLEANIAAGKSTLQNALLPRLQRHFGAEEVVQVDEPVQKWRDNCVLEYAYNDPQVWNFPAQCHFFTSRIEEFRTQYRQHPTARIFFSERSPYTDCMFWNTQLKLNRVDPLLGPIYTDIWRVFQDLVPLRQPSLFLYLDTDPAECDARKCTRGRQEEANVELEYLEALHDAHVDAFGGNVAHMPDGTRVPVLRIDGNLDFHTNPKVADDIARQVIDAIKCIV